MMTMKDKKLNYIVGIAVAVCMAAAIHAVHEYRFYNMESKDIFLYDWTNVWTRLLQTGGLATVLSSFLTQFMRIPFAGPLFAAAVYLAVWWLVAKVMRRRTGGAVMDGFSLMPSAFLFLCMENDYYRFQGHIAFLFVMAAVAAYVSIPKGRIRYLVGLALVPVLYHTAGSVAVVFAVTALLWELMENGWKGLVALAYPSAVLLTAYAYVESSMMSDYEHALTPFMYYDWPSTYFFPAYAWTMVPVLLLASWAFSFMKLKPSFVKCVSVFGLALSLFLAGNFYSQVHSRSFYRMIQEQYWAENEDWDTIIRTADRRQPTFLISYLNLALAHKGILVQNFKYYNPQGLSSLMYPTPNLKTGLTMQSMVYQSWDYHAAARQAAFDANVVTSGNCNPRQLQTLVRTNAALGACDVAEKYISLLEKTLFYRSEARELSRMLDSEVEVIVPATDSYVRYDGIKGDMKDILDVAPSHPILSQFYQVYLILEEEERK